MEQALEANGWTRVSLPLACGFGYWKSPSGLRYPGPVMAYELMLKHAELNVLKREREPIF